MRNELRLISWCFLLVSGACQTQSEEPAGNTLFTLLSPESTGIDFQNTITETPEGNHLVNDMIISGAGVAVGDINNDNLPDLFFTGNQVRDRLFLNRGGLEFEDITDEAGVLEDNIWSSGATMADVNADGYLDIYVTKYVFGEAQLGENLLYINNGDLSFTEMGKDFGLADRGFSVQATFFDFDLDGLIDLYLVNQPPSEGNRKGNKITLQRIKSLLYTDKIYKNNGDGNFYDVTDWPGVKNLAFGLSATVGDLNNDLLPDIYVANDYEKPDHLYMNQGRGQYRDVVNQAVKHMSNFSMGTDIADFDNDGYLDIAVVDMVAEDPKRIKTNMGGMNPDVFWQNVSSGYHYQYMFNTLQRNNGNGTFGEVAHLAGVSNTDWSWSVLFSDFDNDGWKDIFITNGVKRAMRNSDLDNQYSKMLDSLELIAQSQGKELKDVVDLMEFVEMAPVEKLENYVFRNNGDLTFSKKNEEWGITVPTLSYGAAYADLDLDGDVDLIINNTDDYAHVYRNNTSETGTSNYLRVQVLNDNEAPDYGARVKLYRNGEFWQMAELTNARGYKSKSEDVLHFGLGPDKEIEKVEIIYPDGFMAVRENVKANQLLTFQPSEADQEWRSEPRQKTMFTEVTKALNIVNRHRENEYDDYARQVLLPHKMSNFGPGLGVGDVNGDGLEDYYVGGASGFPGELMAQQADRSFQKISLSTWEADQRYEDLGALFFDPDDDGDLDLYVVSGGNEFEPDSDDLQDRLYLNDGKGQFSRSQNILPKMLTSGQEVKASDFDGDGDLDLFVGGRLVPGRYPLPARSYLLRNEGGKFIDITEDVAPDLLTAGLVTAAVWTDFNQDKTLDLVISGEWMPVTLLANIQGRFENQTEKAGLSGTTGWYYSLASADFDNDGDMDLVAGNLGLNYKYKASADEPFEIYSHDFDGNGDLDIVLGYYSHGELFPLRGRSCSSDQIPIIAEKFPTFEAFGDANLRDIYGGDLDMALNYKANTFASSFMENMGDGKFKVRPLPNQAQVSNLNSIITKDFNDDGNLDLLISGNLYPVEIETPRNDAGMGLFLHGDGNGNFVPVPLTKSGFFAPHDAKDMKLITIGTGKNAKEVVLVANNNGYLQAIFFDPEAAKEVGQSLISMK